MRFPRRLAGLAAPSVFGAARVTLGALWLHEGIFKYSAHFGRADILLVAEGARSNSRVPDYFGVLAEGVLGQWPGLFGVVIPLLETTLGVALVLGLLSLPAGLASLLTLMSYWSSDQLIAQYPVMGILSGVVMAWSGWAARLSAAALVVAILRRKELATRLISGPLRRWL
jgi:thiosulfate dehydrogenase [quinone] large subunit